MRDRKPWRGGAWGGTHRRGLSPQTLHPDRQLPHLLAAGPSGLIRKNSTDKGGGRACVASPQAAWPGWAGTGRAATREASGRVHWLRALPSLPGPRTSLALPPPQLLWEKGSGIKGAQGHMHLSVRGDVGDGRDSDSWLCWVSSQVTVGSILKGGRTFNQRGTDFHSRENQPGTCPLAQELSAPERVTDRCCPPSQVPEGLRPSGRPAHVPVRVGVPAFAPCGEVRV